MRWATLLACAALVIGCGSDDGDDSADDAGSAVTAAAFMSCFELEGYEAVDPEKGQESFYSYGLKGKGFEVESVNVQKEGSAVQSAYLSFFADEAKRAEATEEVPPKPIAGGPPALVEGNVVVGYFDDDAQRETGEAIQRCLRS
jgi:hypothetical protein